MHTQALVTVSVIVLVPALGAHWAAPTFRYRTLHHFLPHQTIPWRPHWIHIHRFNRILTTEHNILGSLDLKIDTNKLETVELTCDKVT